MPEYVRTILVLMKTNDPTSVALRHRSQCDVQRHRDLAHLWHPVKNKRDTTEEMKIVLRFKA